MRDHDSVHPVDRVRAGFATVRRFHARIRHLTARHYVLASLTQGAVFAALLVLLSPGLKAVWTWGLLYALLMAGMSLYHWRPGGIARRNYERWCERMDPANWPVAPTVGVPQAGWYADPNRRYRVRYWTGTGWI
jgi:hypothetical protein